MNRTVLLVLLLTVVWGTNWPLYVLAVSEISVWTFRAVCLVSGGGLLLALARIRGDSLRIERGHWATLILVSLGYLVVWNVASTFAAVLIPSGQAAILGYTMPLWAALIAWFALGEKPTGRVLAAVLVGGVGVALLILQGSTAYAQAPLGFALGLLAGLGWAVGTLILKRYPVPCPPIVLAGWQLLVAAVPIAAAAFATGDYVWFAPSTTTILVVAYISLVPIAVGNAVWFTIVRSLPANVAALSPIMVPIIAMVSGALIHREPLGLAQWAAMLCCATGLGLALLEHRPKPSH